MPMQRPVIGVCIETANELLRLPPREAQWEMYLLGFGDEPEYDVDPISASLPSDAIH